MGARRVVFHAGFYQKRSPEETYRRVRQETETLQRCIRRAGWHVELCPEITGKASQFGSPEELLNLMRDTGCGITVDFAHLHARNQGSVDYDGLLVALPGDIHAHFSGIAYTAKGERKHLRLTPEFFHPLLAALTRHGKAATIICESPRPFDDAVLMKTMITAGAGLP